MFHELIFPLESVHTSNVDNPSEDLESSVKTPALSVNEKDDGVKVYADRFGASALATLKEPDKNN